MTSKTDNEATYRIAVLPGIGRVLVPASLSDDEVLAGLDAPSATAGEANTPED